MRPARLLAWALVSLVTIVPVAAGLVQIGLSAAGHIPAPGGADIPLRRISLFLSTPGLATSIRLTLVTGLASAALSLGLAAMIAATLFRRLSATAWARVLAPFLAMPHAALAIGLAFVIAPSGWIARWISPWATGWTVPPDLPTVNDPWGLSLILGLVLKETPFLVLTAIAAMERLPVRDSLRTAAALGYSDRAAWALLILPQVYGLVRLPVYAVLSFSLSVVDMALILGPSTPPTLAVTILRLFNAPDLDSAVPASMAAVLLMLAVISSFGLWWLGERLLGRAVLSLTRSGGRNGGAGGRRRLGAAAPVMLAGLGSLSMLAILLWSFAWRWQFPAILPESWTLATWADVRTDAAKRTGATLGLSVASTLIALALAVLWQETRPCGPVRRGPRALWLYIALIVPQPVFLPGIYTWMLRLDVRPGLPAVLWMHVLSVFPYVLLTLSDPWERFDRRHLRAAASLGAGPAARLLRVRLPLMSASLATAAAVGVAVSVSQYLATLFGGAGRVATLTTEAVALSSGADRRVGAAYALLQTVIPLASYGLALTAPRLLFRRFRGMAGGFLR